MRSPAAEERATDARSHLKAATAHVHERLDGKLSAFDLASKADYGRFLAVHELALPPLEAELRGDTAIGGARAEALRHDLAGLDHEPREPLTLDPPMTGALAAEPSAEATAWGIAYVLQGSRLGAKVLARRAIQGGDPSVTANMRFLLAPSPVRWPSFLARMDEALTDRNDLERATNGAHMAFATFERALDVVLAQTAEGGNP